MKPLEEGVLYPFRGTKVERRGEERRTLEKDLRPRFRAAEIGPRVLARFCGSNISTGLPRNGRTHRQLVRKWLTSLLRVFRPAFHELTVLSAPGSTLPPACHRGLKILPFFSINRPTRKRESIDQISSDERSSYIILGERESSFELRLES